MYWPPGQPEPPVKFTDVTGKTSSITPGYRYDSRNESLDWPQIIRETFAQSKPNFVVMMIGLNDRQPLRIPQRL